MARTVVDRIHQFNQHRLPDLRQLKYQLLCQDPFRFLRGTGHLFYEDWPRTSPLNQAPLVWVCGDLHLENFGTYKGRDRTVYFDINDFDEAALAPCTWDLARLLTSIFVVADLLHLSDDEAHALCTAFLDRYTATLQQEHLGAMDEHTAEGAVQDLLKTLAQRDRRSFLDDRTIKSGKTRRLKPDGQKLRPISPAKRHSIATWLPQWAAQQPNPDFFKLLDVGFRVAGTGSLGIERYALLVEGNGSPHQNYLLDLKAQTPTALTSAPITPQPRWQTEADRVVTIQTRVQWTPPSPFAAVALEGRSYVLRELQPTQDRVNLADHRGKPKRLKTIIEMMGQVTAWSQLRSSGRQGAAIADSLIAFAQTSAWHDPLLVYSRTYANQVEADYQVFVAAMG
jgi:uncharacterized protein (DUF2252 family)